MYLLLCFNPVRYNTNACNSLQVQDVYCTSRGISASLSASLDRGVYCNLAPERPFFVYWCAMLSHLHTTKDVL